MPSLSNIKVEKEEVINDHCGLCGTKADLVKHMGYWTCQRCIENGRKFRREWREFCDKILR